ncbi:hypothetical protein JL720_5310 [Aureococcus anophagefferens]|nr:hypothetical protein JL720_5310 [Aureococcus anophagefferens]
MLALVGDDELRTAALAFAARARDALALLAAGWLRVGFCQGNFNADNCLVGGRTMDYGPFGFMDKYDPSFAKWVGSGDHFAFAAQPALWRTSDAAKALLPSSRTTRRPLRAWLAAWKAVWATAAPRLDAANPKYVLREWMLVEAYEAAKRGDFSVAHELHGLVKAPYDEHDGLAAKYYRRAPDAALTKPGTAFMT